MGEVPLIKIHLYCCVYPINSYECVIPRVTYESIILKNLGRKICIRTCGQDEEQDRSVVDDLPLDVPENT